MSVQAREKKSIFFVPCILGGELSVWAGKVLYEENPEGEKKSRCVDGQTIGFNVFVPALKTFECI